MLIGQDLPSDAGNLVFELPEVPPDWQFLIDIIPAQLAAERLAQISGVDCDSFRFCSFIVEHEYGLLREEAGAPTIRSSAAPSGTSEQNEMRLERENRDWSQESAAELLD